PLVFAVFVLALIFPAPQHPVFEKPVGERLQCRRQICQIAVQRGRLLWSPGTIIVALWCIRWSAHAAPPGSWRLLPSSSTRERSLFFFSLTLPRGIAASLFVQHRRVSPRSRCRWCRHQIAHDGVPGLSRVGLDRLLDALPQVGGYFDFGLV